MKKNISINISGIIFHIEEDGYEQLKDYLESINRYFSTFDDSLEIIADIESRIAEIFLSKLKDGRQVISIDDVEALIATMGSIKDFQAAEEDAAYITARDDSEEKEKKAETGEPLFAKKLYRDKNRKLLAGVLAGLAHYFNVDPLWVRLIYILLFFGVSILPSIGGILLIAYIVLWIVVPESDELKEEKKIKKMYRDPDSKVLGGVAGGIGAYFGVDVVIIRILFFASIFVAGAGLILYIILWIILPEAKTLTDKMEMQGQPVTLSNIESNIKKSLNVEGKEENILVKILLFPFRLIATLFEFLSRALGPLMTFLAEAIRIFIGILFILIGISGILGVLAGIGVVIGLIAGGDLYLFHEIPLDVLQQDIQIVPGIALSLAMMIPFLLLSILGFTIVMKRSALKARFGWSLLALWIISVAVMVFTIRPLIRDFQRDGRYTITNDYDMDNKIVWMRYHDVGASQLEALSMRLASHPDSVVRIEQTYSALGADRNSAIENAKMIDYQYDVADSVITFDSNIRFADNARFRRQELRLNVYMPVNQKFTMDEELRYLLGNFLYRQGFSNRDMEDNIWQFTDDGLECITCETGEADTEVETFEDEGEMDGYVRNYDISDFDEIESSSPFNITIKKSQDYKIIINGKKNDVDDVVLDRTGETLEINFKSGVLPLKKRSDELNVLISTPELHRMEFGGACRSFVNGFEVADLDITLHGAAVSDVDVHTEYLHLELNGASKLNLSGEGGRMEAELSGASTLNAFQFSAKIANVKAHSASTAKITVEDNLEIRSGGSSSIRYRGDPNLEVNKSGGSTVRKD